MNMFDELQPKIIKKCFKCVNAEGEVILIGEGVTFPSTDNPIKITKEEYDLLFAEIKAGSVKSE